MEAHDVQPPPNPCQSERTHPCHCERSEAISAPSGTAYPTAVSPHPAQRHRDRLRSSCAPYRHSGLRRRSRHSDSNTGSRHPDAGSRRHRHARPHAGDRHSRRRHGDRPPDHRRPQLHHADRRTRRRSRPACQPVRRPRRQRQRIRPRHQFQPGARAARWHAAERCIRLLRRVQLRRRHPRRCRAHRGHPRADGGVVRLRRDRRRDQPDFTPGHPAGSAHHWRSCGWLPQADPGLCQCIRHRRPIRLRGDRRRSVAARLRHHAAARIDLHRRARPVLRHGRHAQSRLHADRRHTALAVPAGPRVAIRLQRTGQPDIR